ncbi:Zinc finger protein 271 [Plakobranchus ocellatus]|uniref:Zinc finger protein 271 n=1 Tax=Plakobranchus ocellatus TaxID=259542 RepID=A0AAV4A8N2_9GAST|nr:Zinc finger protein 271 [Plakobranchus ocellatus]
MAALECKAGQDGFSPAAGNAENGLDALPEEKALSIDYSEDLWLAEESSGSYGNKVSTSGVSDRQPPDVDHLDSKSDVIHIESGEKGEVVKKNGEDCGGGPVDTRQQHQEVWPEDTTTVTSGTSSYVNGTPGVTPGGSQNGLDAPGSGDEERDFAQLVPAGTYVEGVVDGIAHHHHHQQQGQHTQDDKTFTSLMPAAAMGVNGEEVMEEEEEEVEGGSFTTMLNSGTHNPSGQVAYYSPGSAAHPQTVPTSNVEGQENAGIAGDQIVQYATQQQVATTNGGHEVVMNEAAGETAGGQVYVTMDALEESGQAVVAAGGEGNYAVLSPALMASQEGQAYTTTTVVSAAAAAGNFHTISTLPFAQNNGVVYPAGTYTNFPNPENSTDGMQQQQQQHIQFVGDPVAASLQQSAIDLNEEEEDEDENGVVEELDLENSLEYSEFTCQVCSESFTDQASLDEHVSNHPPVKTFVCQTCGKSFATRRYLKYHRKNHCKRAGSYEGRGEDESDPNTEIKRFTCNVCSRPFRVLKCMKVHKKKKHGIFKEFTCHTCAVTYASAQDLVDHNCIPKPFEDATPQQTQAVFMSPASAPSRPVPSSTPTVHHQQQQTSSSSSSSSTPFSGKSKRKVKQARPVCDICGKTFSDRISVDIHRVKHIEEEVYPCDMCDRVEGGEADHVAVHFRIRFFTDDNQHILEDQKVAAGQANATVSARIAGQQQQTLVAASSEASINGPVQIIDQQGNAIDHSGFEHFTAGQVVGGINNTIHTGGSVVVSGAADPGYVVSQGEAILMGQNTLLLAPQQPPDQQQMNIAQAQQQQQGQLVEASEYEEGEVIHDVNGSIISIAPGQQQQQPQHVPPLPPKPQHHGGGGAKKKTWKRSRVHHMCDICNKSFPDSGKLELHYKSNHLHDRPYQCDVCDKSFFTKWKLQRHMLSHLERKPHSCPMCSKSFVERGKLEAHYRTHLGTKPYKCDVCSKAFTVKSQLSIHKRRIHSTDQPFGCLVCGKAFLWKSGLDKHMRKHTREKPYVCQVCGTKYSNKANLVTHMTKAHNQTYVEPSVAKSPSASSTGSGGGSSAGQRQHQVS